MMIYPLLEFNTRLNNFIFFNKMFFYLNLCATVSKEACIFCDDVIAALKCYSFGESQCKEHKINVLIKLSI